MTVKRKFVLKPEYPKAKSYKRASFPIDNNGICTFTRFTNVPVPCIRTYGDGIQAVIVAEGNYWLQFGYQGEYYYYTAEYDSDGTLLQIYIDITAGNHFSDESEPYFDDWFADVVLMPDGEIYILDEDELFSAYNCGDITKEQYEKVKALTDNITNELKSNGASLSLYCSSLFKMALGALTNGGI